MEISFDEISDGDKFEDLVASYFRTLRRIDDVSNVKINKSGIGTDGGRDILITFDFFDEISSFTRKWVIQCKFHKKNISAKEISSINIPSLIHSYKASGYLLICRERATASTTDLFERLSRYCNFGYTYEIWTGSDFINKLMVCPEILEQYFPRYSEFVRSKNIQK